jgi:hypothetical protein
MSWWFTPDVTAWPENEHEGRGLRPKVWIVDPTGQSWLRKEALGWRTSELAIEAFTLELARRCGYDVAFGRCCEWQKDEARKRGFISRKFHDDDIEEQATGGELLAPVLQLPPDLTSQQAEHRRRVLSTLEVTRQVLEAQSSRYQVDLIRPFLRMLVFDGWIGNGDRHSANWAILVRGELHGSACRLAPMYDTAGCLLAELIDKSVEQRFADQRAAIERYVTRCPSGFGDGNTKPGIAHRGLLAKLRSWPEWKEVGPALISLFSDSLGMATDTIHEVPEDWLSTRRKDLIRLVLEARVKMLLELVP